MKTKRGAELDGHYAALLRELGTKTGMLGQIFTRSQNKIQDPAKLYRLVDIVDDTEWVTLGADVKGDINEGLLEKNAEDTESGTGQYFTPRALIRAMVERRPRSHLPAEAVFHFRDCRAVDSFQ